MFEFSDAHIEALMRSIYSGRVTTRNLPQSLYQAIGDHLKKGVDKGYGASVPALHQSTKDYELLAELKENTYMFSAAKTYQQVREMSDLLRDGNTVRPFPDFKEEAMKVYDTYNGDWLKAEYNTAIAQAQMAGKWSEIQKNQEVLPNLSYSTIGDACSICAPLDGVTLPIADPFWNEFYPPNHFNCFCTVLQEEPAAKLTEDSNSIAEEVGDKMTEEFKMNSGQDAVVFNSAHAYFENVPKADRDFAKENFGLPIPKSEDE